MARDTTVRTVGRRSRAGSYRVAAALDKMKPSYRGARAESRFHWGAGSKGSSPRKRIGTRTALGRMRVFTPGLHPRGRNGRFIKR